MFNVPFSLYTENNKKNLLKMDFKKTKHNINLEDHLVV